MKLTLDPLDLLPEFQVKSPKTGVDQKINTSQITIDHLTEQARNAVMAVGRATFFSWNKETYNEIYPNNS